MREVVEDTITYEGISGEDESINIVYNQFMPEPGLLLGIKLSKVVGAPIGKAISAIDGEGGLDDDVNMDGIGDAIQMLFENLHEKEVVSIIKELIGVVIANGSGLKMDHQMFKNGNYGRLLKIASKSAEVNFKDFFAEIIGKVNLLKSRVTKSVKLT